MSRFAGREVEVAELSQWIMQEHCRLVTLLSIGGIGKSTLASYRKCGTRDLAQSPELVDAGRCAFTPGATFQVPLVTVTWLASGFIAPGLLGNL